ncbi:MAG TPA: queuosine precursor transporter [Steroidobacteraceae bacterium]|nr:queuosine precursor transporter [Steroidobacteraceae bacterium]
MSNATFDQRPNRLFIALAGFFVANAVIAEFVGVKIFAVEDTLGIAPLTWNLYGETGSLNLTAGVLVWPLVFILTDVINEYFGVRGVRFISYVAVVLVAYAFLVAYASISVVPASWWISSGVKSGVPDMQAAFSNIFGQGMWIIAGSIIAFLIGQLIDVVIFHRIRARSGERHIWFRATASTAVSQLIDSFVVLYISFVIGPQHWPISRFLAVGTVNYCYKLAMAILLIPLIYLGRRLIEGYLGAATAHRLKAEAAR